MEELRSRHRKEQRELQSRITQKKKSATKKTRKGVNEECERLQRELNDKQHAEIAELNGDPESSVNNISVLHLEESRERDDVIVFHSGREEDTEEDTEERRLHTEGGNLQSAVGKDTSCEEPLKQGPSRADTGSASLIDSSSEVNSQPKRKVNRQKARLARRAAERESEAAKAAEEAASQMDNRGEEQELMEGIFIRLGLKEIDVRPDGHCLYSAVAKQLLDFGIKLDPSQTQSVPVRSGARDLHTVAVAKDEGFRPVRAVTADFILSHCDDFAPFIEEPIEEYARKIKLTAEWGGQLELQAIARAYDVRINVVQRDGRIEKFDPDGHSLHGGPKEIWLAYYRHTYGLGEHYNALSPRP